MIQASPPSQRSPPSAAARFPLSERMRLKEGRGEEKRERERGEGILRAEEKREEETLEAQPRALTDGRTESE